MTYTLILHLKTLVSVCVAADSALSSIWFLKEESVWCIVKNWSIQITGVTLKWIFNFWICIAVICVTDTLNGFVIGVRLDLSAAQGVMAIPVRISAVLGVIGCYFIWIPLFKCVIDYSPWAWIFSMSKIYQFTLVKACLMHAKPRWTVLGCT